MFHTSEQQQQQVQHQKALKGEAKGEMASTERLTRQGKAGKQKAKKQPQKGKKCKKGSSSRKALTISPARFCAELNVQLMGK